MLSFSLSFGSFSTFHWLFPPNICISFIILLSFTPLRYHLCPPPLLLPIVSYLRFFVFFYLRMFYLVKSSFQKWRYCVSESQDKSRASNKPVFFLLGSTVAKLADDCQNVNLTTRQLHQWQTWTCGSRRQIWSRWLEINHNALLYFIWNDTSSVHTLPFVSFFLFNPWVTSSQDLPEKWKH